MSNAWRPLLRDREPWVVLSAMVICNVIFISHVSSGQIDLRYFYLGRWMLLVSVLGMGVFAFRGWKAPFGLLKPLTVWRVNPLWILLAVAWPPSIAVLVLVAKGLLSGTGLSEVTPTLEVALNPPTLKAVLIGAFVGEIVWVGYALSRFSQSTTIVVSSLIVGFFWAAWWSPIVILGVGVIPGIPVAALFLLQTALAMMCGFLYAHTRSGWVVFLLQFSANSSLLIFPVSPNWGGVATFSAFGVAYLMASFLLHVKFGPRPLFPGSR